jgi:hypothetical protein
LKRIQSIPVSRVCLITLWEQVAMLGAWFTLRGEDRLMAYRFILVASPSVSAELGFELQDWLPRYKLLMHASPITPENPTEVTENAVAGFDAPTAHSRMSDSSVFHRGIFAPVNTEISATDLTVSGAIPDDLDGLFIRNGPNPLLAPSRDYHWFDGDGMVHAVRIRDGRADYVNRFVRTESFERQRRTGI